MIFAYDLQHWLTFLVAAILLNLSPGPDMAFIIGHTVKSGHKAGLTAMAGIWLDRSLGTLLILMGIKLAVSER